MMPATHKLPRLLAACLLLTALLGCATPRHTLEGTEVLAVKFMSEVLPCEFKGTVTAVIRPSGKIPLRGWNHPVNSGIANELITDAKNRTREIQANRILERTKPFKGTQQFDMFNCPQAKLLKSYAQHIDARMWREENMERFCGDPGPAQCAGHAALCGNYSPPATARGATAADRRKDGLDGTQKRDSCITDAQ